MSEFAKGTTVSVAKSKAEIEDLLSRYGASEFGSAWPKHEDGSGVSMIGFKCRDRFLQFQLPIPSRDDERFWKVPKSSRGGVYCERFGKWATWRTETQADVLWEQEQRRRWRALALVVKAKLEAVSSGITTFDQEFLAHIVIPGTGRTVWQNIAAPLAESYQLGHAVPLLPEFTE